MNIRTKILMIISAISVILIMCTGCSGSDKALIGKWKAISINDQAYDGSGPVYEFRNDNVAVLYDNVTSSKNNMWYQVRGKKILISNAGIMPQKDDGWVINQYRLQNNRLIIVSQGVTIKLEKVR